MNGTCNRKPSLDLLADAYNSARGCCHAQYCPSYITDLEAMTNDSPSYITDLEAMTNDSPSYITDLGNLKKTGNITYPFFSF